MDHIDRSEEPDLSTGPPWDDQGIRWGLDHNRSIDEIASEPDTPEIRLRIREIEEAAAIGDPSLLHDGLTRRDRIALETTQTPAPLWP
jgi:hypothetical protein